MKMDKNLDDKCDILQLKNKTNCHGNTIPDLVYVVPDRIRPFRIAESGSDTGKIGKIINYFFPKSAETWIVFKNKYFDEQKIMKDFKKSSILRDPK
jgi:hypothetical protein